MSLGDLRNGGRKNGTPPRPVTTVRWAGEYADHIERPPKLKRGPNRTPKRKKK